MQRIGQWLKRRDGHIRADARDKLVAGQKQGLRRRIDRVKTSMFGRVATAYHHLPVALADVQHIAAMQTDVLLMRLRDERILAQSLAHALQNFIAGTRLTIKLQKTGWQWPSWKCAVRGAHGVVLAARHVQRNFVRIAQPICYASMVVVVVGADQGFKGQAFKLRR